MPRSWQPRSCEIAHTYRIHPAVALPGKHKVDGCVDLAIQEVQQHLYRSSRNIRACIMSTSELSRGCQTSCAAFKTSTRTRGLRVLLTQQNSVVIYAGIGGT
jgi:hypothetical protein